MVYLGNSITGLDDPSFRYWIAEGMTQIARVINNAHRIANDEFDSLVGLHEQRALHKNHNLEYFRNGKTVIVYDGTTDTHYFFQ